MFQQKFLKLVVPFQQARVRTPNLGVRCKKWFKSRIKKSDSNSIQKPPTPCDFDSATLVETILGKLCNRKTGREMWPKNSNWMVFGSSGEEVVVAVNPKLGQCSLCFKFLLIAPFRIRWILALVMVRLEQLCPNRGPHAAQSKVLCGPV